MSSGWFDCTEPSLSVGKQGVQGAWGGSSTLNLIKPTQTTEVARCEEVCDNVGMVRLCCIFSLYIIAGKQDVQGAYGTYIIMQHHGDSNVWRGLSHEFKVVQLYPINAQGGR